MVRRLVRAAFLFLKTTSKHLPVPEGKFYADLTEDSNDRSQKVAEEKSQLEKIVVLSFENFKYKLVKKFQSEWRKNDKDDNSKCIIWHATMSQGFRVQRSRNPEEDGRVIYMKPLILDVVPCVPSYNETERFRSVKHHMTSMNPKTPMIAGTSATSPLRYSTDTVSSIHRSSPPRKKSPVMSPASYNTYARSGKWATNSLTLAKSSRQVNPIAILRARVMAAICDTMGQVDGVAVDLNTVNIMSMKDQSPDFFGQGLVSKDIHLTSYSDCPSEFGKEMKSALEKFSKNKYDFQGKTYLNSGSWKFWTEAGRQRVDFGSLFNYNKVDSKLILDSHDDFPKLRDLAGQGVISIRYLELFYRMRVRYGKMASEVGTENDVILLGCGFWDFLFQKTLGWPETVKGKFFHYDDPTWRRITDKYPNTFPSHLIEHGLDSFCL